MTAEQFKEEWEENGEQLTPFPPAALQGMGLTKATCDFFITAGLPDSAAPFLSFVQNNGDKSDTIGTLTGIYESLEPEFDKYIYFGSDGSGNPLVIDTADGDKIKWLDHESDFDAEYVNSSILSFAQCLIAERDFIESVDENGEDALMHSAFTDEQILQLKADILAADPDALTGNTFWEMELATELLLREEDSKK